VRSNSGTLENEPCLARNRFVYRLAVDGTYAPDGLGQGSGVLWQFVLGGLHTCREIPDLPMLQLNG
jgi:hypothetical protein